MAYVCVRPASASGSSDVTALATVLILVIQVAARTDTRSAVFSGSSECPLVPPTATPSPLASSPGGDQGARDLLRCGRLCSTHAHCFGFTSSGQDCILHNSSLLECNVTSGFSPGFVYVRTWETALNESTLENVTQACPNYTQGVNCERVMTDCQDWATVTQQNGLYQVLPQGAPYSFPVYCKMGFGGRTMIQWNFHSGLVFNVSWEEYAAGFGDRNNYFWLGLRQLYWLTLSGKASLVIEAEVKDSQNVYAWPRVYYGNFRIADEASSFQLLPPNGTWGALTNCLGNLVGSKFTTFDHGDTTTSACAARMGSGWWVASDGSCNIRCNPNGRLVVGNQSDIMFFQDLDPKLQITAAAIYLDRR